MFRLVLPISFPASCRTHVAHSYSPKSFRSGINKRRRAATGLGSNRNSPARKLDDAKERKKRREKNPGGQEPIERNKAERGRIAWPFTIRHGISVRLRRPGQVEERGAGACGAAAAGWWWWWSSSAHRHRHKGESHSNRLGKAPVAVTTTTTTSSRVPHQSNRGHFAITVQVRSEVSWALGPPR